MDRKPISVRNLVWRLGLPWLLIPLAFGLVFVSVAWSDWHAQKLLASDGILGEAEILRRDIQERRDSDGAVTRHYYLTHRFRPDGQSEMIETRQIVPRALYDAAPEGTILPVTYVWHRPEINTLDLARSWVGPIVFGLIGGALSLGGAGGLVWQGRRVASALRAARITDITPMNLRVNGAKRYRLAWVDAANVRGQSLMARPEIALAQALGDVIVVHIDPQTGRGWWQKQL